jgi:hypothetical protein
MPEGSKEVKAFEVCYHILVDVDGFENRFEDRFKVQLPLGCRWLLRKDVRLTDGGKQQMWYTALVWLREAQSLLEVTERLIEVLDLRDDDGGLYNRGIDHMTYELDGQKAWAFVFEKYFIATDFAGKGFSKCSGNFQGRDVE